MTHDIQQSFSVEAKPEQVWDFLWDVEAVTRCIPGCEQVTVQEAGKTYKALVRKKLGPFAIGMELDVHVIESRAPEFLHVEVSGKDRRLRSSLSEKISLTLRSEDKQQTTVEIAGQFTLDGLLAAINKNLISVQVSQLFDDFAEALRQAILQQSAAQAP